jgi:eukaryotic-like serine/threonine-protein kinase
MSGAGRVDGRARAFRLFEEALALDPPARPAFLDARCAGEPALRATVEALLEEERALTGDGGLLLAPLPADPDRFLGRTLGRFRVVERIGQGGMGAVFRAERTDELGQTVALKVLLGGGLTARQGRRFAREMKTLARLEHPAVARLIDAGVAEDGTPWLAMELVAGGEPIDAYCEARATPLRDRVRLLVELAEAVAQAHRMLVVHRDIKPSNVLVSRDGSPKLIDFGIARLLDDRPEAATLTGETGAQFTPQYAPPEQVSGAPVSVATDVFGLGALAYRLLAGRTLFPEAASPLGYMVAVTQRDPPLASRAARERGAVADARLLRGDLESVLARALSRDPARRYSTADELAEDLRRYLEHRPVRARPQSLLRTAGKFLRRNALAAGLAALLVAGAAAATGNWVWQARRVALERDAARAASARAERINQFLTSMLQASDPAAGGRRDVTVAQVLDRAAEEAQRLQGSEPLVAADALLTVVQTDSSLGRYPEALAAEEAVVRLLRSLPGERRRLAAALTSRADTLWSMSRLAEAEPSAREAIALLEREPVRDPEGLAALAHAREKLGLVLGHSNREAEADAAYRAARDDLRAAGVADLRLANLLDDWAVLLDGLARNAEAWELLQQARELTRRLAPPEYPVALSVEMNSAATLEALGRREEAIEIYRGIIPIRERVFGPAHADTLMVKTCLASLLNDLGRHREAAELAGPTAELAERTVGRTHRLTAFAWNVLGRAECGLDRPGEGLSALRRAEAARLALAGDRNWLTANTRVLIGACLARAGRRAEAEAVLLPAVQVLEESRGTGFERTQDAYRALRDLYLGWGRGDEAARWGGKLTGP